MQGKAEDAGGLTPAKDDNAAMRTLYPRAFARNSDDCYNNLEGFNTLLDKLRACSTSQDSIKVGLEATGHYSYNILGFLLDNGLAT